MGTSYQLYLADYPVLSWKGEVEPSILTVFRDNDKRVYERKVSQRNRFAWSGLMDDNRTEVAHEYANKVRNIKQRLDVMGFSLGKVRQEFADVIREEIEDIKGHRSHRWGVSKEFLASTSFDDWMAAFRIIYEQKLLLWPKDTVPDDPIVKYLIEDGFVDTFPCYDLRSFLRVFLEVCPEDGLVILDITDLVENRYYHSDDALCASAIGQISKEIAPSQKIVILTEGSTDAFFLDKSLGLLYPHLADYYSFMDFGGSNSPGGASFLVNTIKAFIGSGIGNRVIAMFDNDTAAQVAMKGLVRTSLPDNIRIATYPNLEFAKRYPTMGPSGLAEQDINGSACSIEIYLGLDVLTQDGKLVPIQWKSYDESLRRYQGEVMNKKRLHAAFRAKLEKCSSEPGFITKTDWEAMRLIFRAIFEAFA